MRRRFLGRKVNTVNATPNTFIGGVASAIPDAQSLAIRLNISLNDIGYFGINSGVIEAAINVSYQMPNMWNVSQWQGITKFLDNGGKVIGIGPQFMRNLASLSDVVFPEITTLTNYVFRFTALVNVEFPKVTSMAGIGVFMNNLSLNSVSLPELLTIASGNSDGAFSSTGLTLLNIPKCTSIGTSALSGIPGTCEIICPIFLQTSNAGAEHPEIAYARGRGCTITYV